MEDIHLNSSFLKWCRFTVKVGYMQIDNQLPLTPMPVLLAPELHEEDFVIKAIASMKVETNEAIQVYPYLGLKVCYAFGLIMLIVYQYSMLWSGKSCIFQKSASRHVLFCLHAIFHQCNRDLSYVSLSDMLIKGLSGCSCT